MVPCRLEAFATKLPPARVGGMLPYDPATESAQAKCPPRNREDEPSKSAFVQPFQPPVYHSIEALGAVPCV